jgi:hypothetical protein
LAIMTVHAGRRADLSGPPDDTAPDGCDDDLAAFADDLTGMDTPHAADLAGDDRTVADGRLILSLIGENASSEDVGELIVALGMLGAILAEEAGDATGRDACDVLRELALRYVA